MNMKLQDMRVLVSDDSILMKKRLKNMVETLGCQEVIEASNGQEAIDLYKEHRPDLVFMDIIMPEKTGAQAIEEIKAFDQKAYIVIVSPQGTKNKVKEAIEAGANDFLPKPMKQEQVEKMIKHYME